VNRYQIVRFRCWVAANALHKPLRTAEMGGPPTWVLDFGLTTRHRKKKGGGLLCNFTQDFGLMWALLNTVMNLWFQ
jgi:hypothetical protein